MITKKVDFLIIGAQKGGTTALYYYLRNHPEIEMEQEKELHFFDDENAFAKTPPNYLTYESQFENKKGARIFGEATPNYLYWIPSCQRILAYNTNIKLIALLRNPIERAYSHWNMEFKRNAEFANFEFCIESEKKRLAKVHPHQHRVYSYIDRGMYAEQIKRYKKFFNEDQLLFIKYEDFKNNNEKVLIKIFNFLGANSMLYNFVPSVYNNSKYTNTLLPETKNHLINLFSMNISEVEKLLNWDCSDWLR
ncbi:MAG: sulfotransferase domain-containing protein [Bacteroidia bacterium]